MNTTVRILMTLAVMVLLLPIAASARGLHGHYRGGGFGVWMDPWWIVPYPYYSVPPVIVQQPSTDYYEQPVPRQSQEPAYWYYCRNPEGYYPYVKQCPDGWMKVVPTPPEQIDNEGGMR